MTFRAGRFADDLDVARHRVLGLAVREEGLVGHPFDIGYDPVDCVQDIQETQLFTSGHE